MQSYEDWMKALPSVQHSLAINKKANESESLQLLKFSNLREYIEKVILWHKDENLEAAIVIVQGLEARQFEYAEKQLRKVRAAIPAGVVVEFVDGGVLQAKFDKKKDDSKNPASKANQN